MSDDIEGTAVFSSSSLFSLDSVVRRDVLTQIKGPGAPKHYPIVKSKSVIGRSADADIQILSSLVSRFHLSLEREEIELFEISSSLRTCSSSPCLQSVSISIVSSVCIIFFSFTKFLEKR